MLKNLRWKIAQTAEIYWWKNYLRHKAVDDYLEWKKKYWQTFLQNIQIQFKTGEIILDVGCGPAGIFTILNTQQVDALDPLIPQYEKKLKHFTRSDYPHTTFYVQAFEQYTPVKKYSKVFCLNAINHVANLRLCMDKLEKVTKGGGMLILSIDTHKYTALKRIFRLLPGDILHPHQHDLKEYETMLCERAFDIEKRILIKSGRLFDYHVILAKKRDNPLNES